MAEVAKLKEQPGRELQLHGSGALAQTLFDAGLIDTIRLIVFPVVLGSGKRLFAEGRTPSSFRLVDVTSTGSGATMQTLELTGSPSTVRSRSSSSQQFLLARVEDDLKVRAYRLRRRSVIGRTRLSEIRARPRCRDLRGHPRLDFRVVVRVVEDVLPTGRRGLRRVPAPR